MNDAEKKVVEHEQQIKTLFNRVDKLEGICESINSLALSVERLAMKQDTVSETVENISNDVNKMKERESNDAHEIKMKVVLSIITSIIGIIIGALFALIMK